jgi:acetyltransferase-like isoleucine patch superfamily enzyme
MLEKFLRIFKVLTNPHLYRELFRWHLYYAYEHAIPMKNIKVGNNPEIHPNISIRFEKNIALGDNIVIDMNCCLWASENSRITIGNNTGIGPGTVIVSSNHAILKNPVYTEGPMSEKDITIGNNVWIGANSVILAGACIGDNTIIGAGCVVSRAIPENSLVVAGNRTLSIVKRK